MTHIPVKFSMQNCKIVIVLVYIIVHICVIYFRHKNSYISSAKKKCNLHSGNVKINLNILYKYFMNDMTV